MRDINTDTDSYRDIYFRVNTLKHLCEGYFAPLCLIIIIILIMLSMTTKGETVLNLPVSQNYLLITNPHEYIILM